MQTKNFPCEVGKTYTRAEVVECKKYLAANTKIIHFSKKQNFSLFPLFFSTLVYLQVTYFLLVSLTFKGGFYGG